MTFKIEKATRKKQKLRLLVEGLSGSGKSMSALILAKALGKKICVIDTEDGSASLYEDICDFDVINMPPPYSPNNLILAIDQLEKADYDVIIVDSLSAFWSSQGGILDQQTMEVNKGTNSFQAWGKLTPIQNKMLEKIQHCTAHIICTARTKADYVMEEYTAKNGKTSQRPVKVGLKTEQKEGLDYNFTIVFRLDREHTATAVKTRASVFDNYYDVITEETGKKILEWLEMGEEDKPQKPDIHNHFGKKIAECNTLDELVALYNSNPKEAEEYKVLFSNRKEVLMKGEN